MTINNSGYDTLCVVDASDEDVQRLREKYSAVNIYRRDFDEKLPVIKGVLYLLPSDEDKYNSVLTRDDVTTEVAL